MRAIPSMLLAALLVATPAVAHEYWIEAEKFHPATVEDIEADLRVGSDLSGESFPWLKQSFTSVLLWPPSGGSIPLTGRAGDLPALRASPQSVGLHRITVETTPSFVIFDKPGKFETYLTYEGLLETLTLHRERGLPETGFGERYVRNAKALIQIGTADDRQSDAPVGMPLELVATGNPYAAGQTRLSVRLLWQGMPVPDAQVALFYAAPGSARPDDVERTLFTTDDQGSVSIPLLGPGLHLLSSVRIEPIEDSTAAAWQSWWASLTFAPGP